MENTDLKKVTKKDLLKKIESMKNDSRRIEGELQSLNRNIENMEWFVNLSDDPEKLNKAVEFAHYILRVLEEKTKLSEMMEYE